MKILIENLNSGTTEEDLSCLLGDLKGFLSLVIRKDKFGLSEGIGYAQFESRSDGQKAIAKYNGYQMMGRLLKITQIKVIPEKILRGPFWR